MHLSARLPNQQQKRMVSGTFCESQGADSLDTLLHRVWLLHLNARNGKSLQGKGGFQCDESPPTTWASTLLESPHKLILILIAPLISPLGSIGPYTLNPSPPPKPYLPCGPLGPPSLSPLGPPPMLISSPICNEDSGCSPLR